MNPGKPQERLPEPQMQAAIEAATAGLSKAILNTIVLRGGNGADVANLLGRINALVISTLADGTPNPHETVSQLIAEIMEKSMKVSRRISTMEMLKGGTTMRGHRP